MENNVEHEVRHLSKQIQEIREELAELRLVVKMVYDKYVVPVYHGGDTHVVTRSRDGSHLSCCCHEFNDVGHCDTADAVNKVIREKGPINNIEFILPNGVHWWARRLD